MSEPAKNPRQVPESCQPKKPEIVRMAQQASQDAAQLPAVKAATATIKTKDRSAVRVIELPACKMVSSGRCAWGEAFGPGGPLTRFGEWFSAFDETRADRFYVRDFMWGPTSGAWVEWAYAVTDIPKAADGGYNLDGFELIDFPGGLFAVAVSVDGDGRDHDRVHSNIQKWVKKSGCFALDETDQRFSMGNITSPMRAKEAMGYHQMDLYFPIRIREAHKK